MANQIVISRPGAPEVLEARPVPRQRVGADELRIRVAAAGVNFADVVGRLGNYPDAPPIPYCPGYEVAGTVVELGSEVPDLAVGDRVGALTRFGGYADEVVVRAEQVVKLPDAVDVVAAAALPVVYLTAHTSLFDAGGLTPGKTVLINGGAGGVGSAAIQMARQLDVTIIATAGSSAKVEWMREQGVHHPLDYNEVDVAEAVKELTGGRGVDLVLDPMGGRGIARSIAMCAPLGRVVLYGISSMNPGKRRSLLALVREGLPMRFFNLPLIFNHNVGLHGINMLRLAESDPPRTQRVMRGLLADVVAGRLAPVIAERFPLTAEGAAAAHHFIQDRKNVGKVVLVAKDAA